jgi:hypothetical protein
MPLIQITEGFAPADVTAIMAAVDVVRQKLIPNMVNFTPDEKKNYFILGFVRESFVDKMMTIATQHEDTVPVDVKMVVVNMLNQFYIDLKTIKANKSDVDDLIDNLILNTGILLLGSLNRVYNNARDLAEKGNYPFNDLVKEAGKLYEKGPKNTGTVFTIAGNAQVTINKVITKSSFVNNGTTVLKIAGISKLTGEWNMEDAIAITPGNSIKLQKGFSSIVVMNMSGDQDGNFIVKLKT